ncbi:MAG: prepilin-type N-terminal cleavage/methylation domain-containing protein, partial [Thermoguttaceae bacterium]
MMTSRIIRRDRASRDRRAFTLLEILLVLALMSVLLVGVSSIVRLFSRNYTANERRVGRAQLARSISQMLSDDLGAAVQDPILDVGNDPNRE